MNTASSINMRVVDLGRRGMLDFSREQSITQRPKEKARGCLMGL